MINLITGTKKPTARRGDLSFSELYIDMGAGESVVDMKGMDTCREHGGTFRYHCKDHDTLCCELCQYTEMHMKCDNLFDINDLVTTYENNDVKHILESIHVQANGWSEQGDAKVRSIETKVETIRKEIDNKTHLIKQLEERARAIKKAQTDLKDTIKLNNDVQASGTESQKYIARTMFARGQITQWSILKDLIETNMDIPDIDHSDVRIDNEQGSDEL